MPVITINKGGVDIADGVYPVILTSLTEKTIVPQQGKQAGQEVDIFVWGWAVDDTTSEYDGVELQSNSSMMSGAKSKLFGYITALLGGTPPAIGSQFEVGDLVGRRALATVRTPEDGFAKIENLSALPASMRPKPVTATVAAARQAAEVRQPATPADELPF